MDGKQIEKGRNCFKIYNFLKYINPMHEGDIEIKNPSQKQICLKVYKIHLRKWLPGIQIKKADVL